MTIVIFATTSHAVVYSIIQVCFITHFIFPLPSDKTSIRHNNLLGGIIQNFISEVHRTIQGTFASLILSGR